MTWESIVSEILDKEGFPRDGPDHPYNYALANALMQMHRNASYESLDEFRNAIVHVWVQTCAPLTFIEPELWTEIFAAVGPIEYGRPLPTEATTVYRHALSDESAGWSWTVDPWNLLTAPRQYNVAPQGAFETLVWKFPEREWFATRIDPQHICLTTELGEHTAGAMWALTTDEIVVHPANLGAIEVVPTDEMRRLFFDNAIWDKDERRWHRQYGAERSSQRQTSSIR
jgi:hypothetical protein